MSQHDDTLPVSTPTPPTEPAHAVTFDEVEDPPLDLLREVNRGLGEYNHTQIGERPYMRLGIFAYADDAHTTLIGGVFGDLVWDWLHIDTLWVHPDYRGQDIGTGLMRRAEAAARARGIVNIHLETTSFQALPFYQKLGFEVFGELPNKPRGATWYYLKKEGEPTTEA